MHAFRYLLGLAVLALAAMIVATPASAASPNNKAKRIADPAPAPVIETVSTADAPVWTGVYIGAHGGYGLGVGELSAPGFSFDGISAQGLIGGLHVGYDAQLYGSPVVIRARGSYTWGDVETTLNLGGFGASAAIGNNWSVDGGLGYSMGNVLPYVFVGKTEAETSLSWTGGSASGPTLEGMRYGGGVEWKLGTTGVSAALEYTFTDYDTLKVGPLNLDIDDHRVLGRLNFRLPGGALPSLK